MNPASHQTGVRQEPFPPQTSIVTDSDLCQTQLHSVKKLPTTIPAGYKRKTARVKAGPQMFPTHFMRKESPDAMVRCEDSKRVSGHREELAKQSLLTHWLGTMQTAKRAPRFGNGLWRVPCGQDFFFFFTQHTYGTQELGVLFSGVPAARTGRRYMNTVKGRADFLQIGNKREQILASSGGLVYFKAAKGTGKETYRSLRCYNYDHEEDGGLKKLPKAFLTQLLEFGVVC